MASVNQAVLKYGFRGAPLAAPWHLQNFRTGALSALNRELRSSTIVDDDKVDKKALAYGSIMRTDHEGMPSLL